jgi:hypothetical protein
MAKGERVGRRGEHVAVVVAADHGDDMTIGPGSELREPGGLVQTAACGGDRRVRARGADIERDPPCGGAAYPTPPVPRLASSRRSRSAARSIDTVFGIGSPTLATLSDKRTVDLLVGEQEVGVTATGVPAHDRRLPSCLPRRVAHARSPATATARRAAQLDPSRCSAACAEVVTAGLRVVQTPLGCERRDSNPHSRSHNPAP